MGCIILYTVGVALFVLTPVNGFQAWEDLRQLDSSTHFVTNYDTILLASQFS